MKKFERLSKLQKLANKNVIFAKYKKKEKSMKKEFSNAKVDNKLIKDIWEETTDRYWLQ